MEGVCPLAVTIANIDPLLIASTKSSHAGPVGAVIASFKNCLSPNTPKSLKGSLSKDTMVCPSYSKGSSPISVLYSAKSSVDIPTLLPLSSLRYIFVGINIRLSSQSKA